MQTKLTLLTAAAIVALSGPGFAQTSKEHQQHHPGGAPTQAQPAQPSQPTPTQPPAPDQPSAPPPAAGQPSGGMPMGQMMQRMPEQCRAMMQNMPQNCMSMMQEMMRGDMRQGGMGSGMMGGGMQGGMMGGGMQGGAMHGGMMGGGMQGGAMQNPASASDATKAYVEVADKMYSPIMQGLQADDPDVAFVRAMIAHRQAAIDLAKVRVQFGKDEQTRKWADDIIRSQKAAIDEMQAWLKQRGK